VGLLDALPGEGPGRRESLKVRDAVSLPREAEVQRFAAGRVIIRHEEGRLALRSFHFVLLGGQVALGAKQPVLRASPVAGLPMHFACAPRSIAPCGVVFRLVRQGRHLDRM
jgi:hypothetical protein